MTKEEALQTWFSQFMAAYPASELPDDAVLPRLTYDQTTGSWDSGEMALTANLWYHAEHEALSAQKAQELADAIGLGGVLIHYDGGAMWFKRGTPWCQSGNDEVDPTMKRRSFHILVEYLSMD